ncbi:MAG: hypothetical protein QG619_2090, partial [Pseudomonadota bacterium]|nr:hypothetical protein [Pseudomonadota bacterium]
QLLGLLGHFPDVIADQQAQVVFVVRQVGIVDRVLDLDFADQCGEFFG